jgi:hypothetical protein
MPRFAQFAILCLVVLCHAKNALSVAFTTFDYPNATISGLEGVDANDSSKVVGFYFDSLNHSHGYLYDGSSFSTIDYPTARATSLTGVSGSDAVGWYTDNTSLQRNHGFVFNGSTYSQIDDPLAGGTTVAFEVNGTQAYGISGNNVVGTYTDSSNVLHGFLFNGSSYQTIDDPQGVGGTVATGVFGNTIVGYYMDASSYRHGFIYNGSSFTTLNAPQAAASGTGTQIWGISGNIIVGSYEDAYGAYYGFVNYGSTYLSLRDPIAYDDTRAYGVSGSTAVGTYETLTSDSGGNLHIYSHGFVTTVPEPASVALLTTGSISLFLIQLMRSSCRRHSTLSQIAKSMTPSVGLSSPRLRGSRRQQPPWQRPPAQLERGS